MVTTLQPIDFGEARSLDFRGQVLSYLGRFFLIQVPRDSHFWKPLTLNKDSHGLQGMYLYPPLARDSRLTTRAYTSVN